MARDYRPVHSEPCRCHLCVPGTAPPRPDEWKFQVRFRAFGDRGFGLEEFVESLPDAKSFFEDYLAEARRPSNGFLMSITPRGGNASTWKEIPSTVTQAKEALPHLLSDL